MREPSEEGENIAELDIRAGGEPSHDELRSAPPGGSNSQRIIFQQKKTSNLISKSLKLILCKSQDWGSDRDWQIQTQVCLGSKFSLSGILWGFSSSLSFYSEFHGGLALRITGLLFSSSYVPTMYFWTHLYSHCFGWFRDEGSITRSHSPPW